MWKAVSALDDLIEYSQLGPNRWRATYRGFVTLSTEGRDPRDAQYNLGEAFDLFLANLIRSSHRPLKAEPDGGVRNAERVPARSARLRR